MPETDDNANLFGKQPTTPEGKIDCAVRTEEEQDQAVVRLLQAAQKKLWLMDDDGLTFRLEAHRDTFSQWLKGLVKMRLLVMNLESLRSGCPRLMKLFQAYAHKVTLRQMEEGRVQAGDSLLVADGRHALVRYTPDEPRGMLWVNQAHRVTPHMERLEALWSRAEPPSGFTVLGL